MCMSWHTYSLEEWGSEHRAGRPDFSGEGEERMVVIAMEREAGLQQSVPSRERGLM